MSPLNFAQYKLISFDCYGTLIDWETGILTALQPILVRHDIRLAEAQILQAYARIESSLQRGPYQTYREILRGVVWHLGLELKFTPTAAELDCLPESLAAWQPFPGTISALQTLKRRYQLAILSNIDDELFAATAQHLTVRFDLIITAQQLQSYKPSRKHFHELIQRTGLAPDQILHVAESMYHDIIPAQQLGFASVWLPRQNRGSISLTRTLGDTAEPDLEVPDLKTLVEIMAKS